MSDKRPQIDASSVLARADQLQRGLGERFRDRLVEALYDDARRVATRAVVSTAGPARTLDSRIDRLLTSRVFGLPIMLFMLSVVFWLTISGANVPSAFLASALMEQDEGVASQAA